MARTVMGLMILRRVQAVRGRSSAVGRSGSWSRLPFELDEEEIYTVEWSST